MDIREKISKAALDAFEQIRNAEEEFRKAEANLEKYKTVTNGNPVEMAKSSMAKAEYEAAQASLRNIKRNAPGWMYDSLEKMRKEYAAELERKYGVDAADIDMMQLELLKSGIMKPGEFRTMLDNAVKDGNLTMVRLIAKYASDAAKVNAEKYGINDAGSVELRMVAHTAVQDPVKLKLEVFDQLSDIITRCVNNPAMAARYWDSLSQPLLEQL